MNRPSFQFYPADFMRDVDDLSPAARGAWISLLCKMHWSRPRGQYRSDMKGLARIMGTTADHAEALIREIKQREVCDLVYHEDATVTVTNRRMSREEKERESTRCRVEEYRKRKSNEKVTPPSSSSSSSSEQNTLSGSSPDPPPLNGKKEAVEVLDFLNQKANRHYRPSETNLKFIQARLRSGATVAQCKQVIALKARKWLLDPKMSEYLRPATLFNATKFEQYIGELLIHVDDSLS